MVSKKAIEKANSSGPVDLEAEEAVLSAVLTLPETLLELIELKRLTEEDFGITRHANVWRAIVHCDNEGKAYDRVTVGDALKKLKLLDDPTKRLLDDLVSKPIVEHNVLDYAEIIIDKAKLRNCLAVAHDIAGAATSLDAIGNEVLTLAESEVFTLSQNRSGNSMQDMKQGVADVLSTIAKASSRNSIVIGHSTGLKDLDKKTGGFQPGQLITIAARPGMGKTAFAMQIGRHMAQSTGEQVAVLSYEMTTRELTFRMLASSLGVSLQKLQQGNIPTEMAKDLALHAQRIEKLPMLISDEPPLTVSGVRSMMRRVKKKGPLAAVIIDYLQLMEGERRSKDENRNAEISEMTRNLKRMAKELEVPVIVLSQLSRNVESRTNKRPMPSDLRDSGSIEQESDLILFIYREAVYSSEANYEDAELIIGKQRSGPLGTINLKFEGEFTRFKDYDPYANPF